MSIQVTQAARSKVQEASFDLAPSTAPWPGTSIRHVPVRQPLLPGVHVVGFRWDGRDDHGRRVAPGDYRLYGSEKVDQERDVVCSDGSPGVEGVTGASEGSTVAMLVLPA
jgi:flagellar hook assembly protein FlgD